MRMGDLILVNGQQPEKCFIFAMVYQGNPVIKREIVAECFVLGLGF